MSRFFFQHGIPQADSLLLRWTHISSGLTSRKYSAQSLNLFVGIGHDILEIRFFIYQFTLFKNRINIC